MSILFLLVVLIAIGLVIRFVMSAYAQKRQQEQEEQDELDYQLLKRSKLEQTSPEALGESGASRASGATEGWSASEAAISPASQAGSSSPDEVVTWAHAHEAPDASDILHQHILLTDGRFDFSLESLKHLDDWLESLRVYKDIIPPPLFQSSIYWAGAYFGETLVRLGQGKFRWISWEDYMRDQHDTMRNMMPQSFEYHQILKRENGATFPFSKVSKFMDNGPEESTHYLATTVL